MVDVQPEDEGGVDYWEGEESSFLYSCYLNEHT
jgi:hypothetical protein